MFIALVYKSSTLPVQGRMVSRARPAPTASNKFTVRGLIACCRIGSECSHAGAWCSHAGAFEQEVALEQCCCFQSTAHRPHAPTSHKTTNPADDKNTSPFSLLPANLAVLQRPICVTIHGAANHPTIPMVLYWLYW